jgi:hypothetical protein
VRTSDLPSAGTDADVALELVGAAGVTSGPQPLRGPAPGLAAAAAPFARGAADAFQLVCRDLGELAEAVVSHDGRGAHPAWHLEQLEVADAAAGAAAPVTFFDARRWVGGGPGGGPASARLRAAQEDPRAAAVAYLLTLHTSGRPGAGLAPVGSTVAVDLRGVRGDAPWQALTAAMLAGDADDGRRASDALPLARGSSCAFRLPPCRDLGELACLRIRVAPPADGRDAAVSAVGSGARGLPASVCGGFLKAPTL